MDFSNIRKWMQKMNNILEVYASEEAFTQSEKNLLLDYNLRIREAILNLQLENRLAEEESRATDSSQESHSGLAQVEEHVAAPTPAASGLEYPELLEVKESGDLSGKLEATPIARLANAFGLNERILFQNILFDGDKQQFDSAVGKLDELKSYDEAKQYLCQSVIGKYHWTDDNKLKNAQIFVKLIRRRYA
ncbi:MAG: hypothetical protein KBF37_08040 [Saprospiraceae bacterium]|jgi:hypothetical protein|nr:hypothetical protein [Saprospiraceae bacterium]MBP9210253.1 hypothetical protein [Saprospiraceae bacterium]MBV6473769.1 hypothetical protein [Saprospiraceae bacterium]